MLIIIEKKIHGVLSTQRALCKWHLSLRHHSYGRRVYGEWVAPGAERPAFRRQMSGQCKEAFLTVPVAAALCRRGVVTEGVWRNPFSGVLEKVPAYGRTGSDQNWATSHVTWELMKKLLDPGQETLIQKAGECVSLTLSVGQRVLLGSQLGNPQIRDSQRHLLAERGARDSSTYKLPCLQLLGCTQEKGSRSPQDTPSSYPEGISFQGPHHGLEERLLEQGGHSTDEGLQACQCPKVVGREPVDERGSKHEGRVALQPDMPMLARQHRADEFRLFTCALWSLA